MADGELVDYKPEVQVLSFKMSPDIGKLVAALCKAQLAFDPIKKESENPAFKRNGVNSKYADMHSLVTATRRHLNDNGLAIMQFPSVVAAGKNLVVSTLMAHDSGQWVSSELLIPATDERGFTAHSIGKAMTYARRFSWSAITGTTADEDDDGNEASGQGSVEAAREAGEKKLAAMKAAAPPKEEAPAPRLTCWPAGDGFEVTGSSDVMAAHKELLLAYGKRTEELNESGKPKPIVIMTAEGLDGFKHQFIDVRKGVLHQMKAKKVG
jgi:hypothetical protein